MQTANILLPYLIDNVLAYGEEIDLVQLHLEISTVLSSAANSVSSEANALSATCAQTVFELIDTLDLWFDDASKSKVALKPKTSSRKVASKPKSASCFDRHFVV
jgi:hypothetical protein